nr:MAG TPA: hypothetical protein [Caudoviricetes sp.]
MFTVCSFVLTSYANHYTPINCRLQHNLVRFAKIAINFAHDRVYNANRT